MARRRKKGDGEDPSGGDGGGEPKPPSLEERVAVLERTISEKDELLMRQSRALVVAAENGQRLRESRAKVSRLERIAEDASLKAKNAKKAHEAAIDEHFALEQELDSGQQRLPFGPDEAEAPPAAGGPAPAGGRSPAAPAPAPASPLAGPPLEPFEPDDESWRVVPLATLGIDDELSDSILAKLSEAGMVTVGNLADYGKPDPATGRSKLLVDIPGIGPASADKIESALDQFWPKWLARRKPAAGSSGKDPAKGDEPEPDEDQAGGGEPVRDVDTELDAPEPDEDDEDPAGGDAGDD